MSALMPLRSVVRQRTTSVELADMPAVVETMESGRMQNKDITQETAIPPSWSTMRAKLNFVHRLWNLPVSLTVPQDADIRDHFGRWQTHLPLHLVLKVPP